MLDKLTHTHSWSGRPASRPSYLPHTTVGSRSLFEGERQLEGRRTVDDHENGTNDDPVELSFVEESKSKWTTFSSRLELAALVCCHTVICAVAGGRGNETTPKYRGWIGEFGGDLSFLGAVTRRPSVTHLAQAAEREREREKSTSLSVAVRRSESGRVVGDRHNSFSAQKIIALAFRRC